MKGIFQIAVLILALFAAGCSTNRRAFFPGEVPEQKIVSSSDEQYGHEVFNTLLDQYELDNHDEYINRVRSITDRLTEKVNPNQNQWHVHVLVDDEMRNAAATRGNYVFVWTGMLKAASSDEELATVIAHEIGHVLAGHTEPTPEEEVNEMIAGIAGLATGAVVQSTGRGGILADLADSLIRESVKALIVNPEQQRKELEADQMGLFIMADAGYDPQSAIDFWDRVQHDPAFSEFPIEFLSSHPSSERRLEALKKLLPEAQSRYDESKLDRKAPSQRKQEPMSAKKVPAEKPRRSEARVSGPVPETGDY